MSFDRVNKFIIFNTQKQYSGNERLNEQGRVLLL